MGRKETPLYKRRERDVENLVKEYKSADVSPRRSREIESDLFERFHKVSLKIANKYKYNPIEIGEMALAGMVEYKKALDKYEPDHEGSVKFVGYAAQGIKFGIIGAIREHYGIKSNWQKHLFSNEATYRAEALANSPDLSEEDADRIVAKRFFEYAKSKPSSAQLGVISSHAAALEKLQDYKAMMATARQVQYASSADFGDVDDVVSVVDRAPDDDAMPTELLVNQQEEAVALRSILAQAFAKLNDREKRVFTERLPRYDDESIETSLESLSEDMGVSRERVRQIYVSAHQKVQREIILAARDAGLTNIAGLNFGDMDMPDRSSTKTLFKTQTRSKPAPVAVEHELT